MSIHPSLRISEADKKQRSVLKRTERIHAMIEKGKWKKGDPIYNLPKHKVLKIKAGKKEKAPKEGAEATAAAGAPAAKAAPAKK